MKTQLKKARKAKRLLEARNMQEADRRKRFCETRIQVLEQLTKEDKVLIPGS
jgi:transcription elongation GreA/GreB family factor